MELLAPAGSWTAFLAAIKNGADAVYIGGKNFSARQYAENFDIKQIDRAVEYAHLRGKKVYVAVNTLVDNSEFSAVLDYIWELYECNTDGIIVQDLGLLNAVRRIIPMIRVHASTQMTVHNAEGVQFLKELGATRVILSREMSLDELRIIRHEAEDVEIEVFVHGALCFSYSGQCLFSSIVGGRSGNRGRCAQPCRLAYDLHASKRKPRLKTPGKGRYLLSPADLCLVDYLLEMKKIGIASLKIEGRVKRPEYVAVVTRVYREVLDMIQSNPDYKVPEELKKDLLKVFNRNFTSGHFTGNRTGFLSTKRPNNRGIYVGRVADQDKDFNTSIRLSDTVNIGDGLEIWVSKGKTPAFIVKEMQVSGKPAASAQSGDIVNMRVNSRVSPGDRVFKTHDDALLSEAARSYQEENKITVDAEVYLHLGEPLWLVLSDEQGNRVDAFSRSNAQVADRHPLDQSVLTEKIGRLGNSPFRLRKCTVYSDGNLMIPFSEINDTRRRAVEELIQLKTEGYRRAPADKGTYQSLKEKYLSSAGSEKSEAQIPVLSIAVSGVKEACSAVEAGADRVYIALEGIGRQQKIGLNELRELIAWAVERRSEIVPALPRIQKPGNIKDWENLLDTGCMTVMAGNLGALKWCIDKKINTIADYSLNIFNSYSFRYLLELGVQGSCLSPELNFLQLHEFEDIEKAEIIVHGEIILMVSEYCMLSDVLGRAGEKCPGYCRQDDYYIQDEKGYKFPLATDAYCRFYIFNSRTLCLIDDLDQVLSLGLGSIRIESRRSSCQQIESTVTMYRKALDELARGKKVDLGWYKEQLACVSSSPFTKCHYYRGVL